MTTFIRLLAVASSLVAIHSARAETQTAQPSQHQHKAPEATPDSAPPAAVEMRPDGHPKPIAPATGVDRPKFEGLILYSPLDLVIPNKFGLTFGYHASTDQTWEAEYLRGSIASPLFIADIGRITDQRLSVQVRHTSPNSSFNWTTGLTYFDFSIHLGDAFINRLTGGSYPSVDMVVVRSLGLTGSIGNRWHFNRDIEFGVDWLTWAQPIFQLKRESAFLDYATNQSDRDAVDKALAFASYLPRFAVLKFQVGMLFP